VLLDWGLCRRQRHNRVIYRGADNQIHEIIWPVIGWETTGPVIRGTVIKEATITGGGNLSAVQLR
jgi:hypothetical protein